MPDRRSLYRAPVLMHRRTHTPVLIHRRTHTPVFIHRRAHTPVFIYRGTHTPVLIREGLVLTVYSLCLQHGIHVHWPRNVKIFQWHPLLRVGVQGWQASCAQIKVRHWQESNSVTLNCLPHNTNNNNNSLYSAISLAQYTGQSSMRHWVKQEYKVKVQLLQVLYSRPSWNAKKNKCSSLRNSSRWRCLSVRNFGGGLWTVQDICCISSTSGKVSKYGRIQYKQMQSKQTTPITSRKQQRKLEAVDRSHFWKCTTLDLICAEPQLPQLKVDDIHCSNPSVDWHHMW